MDCTQQFKKLISNWFYLGHWRGGQQWQVLEKIKKSRFLKIYVPKFQNSLEIVQKHPLSLVGLYS